MALKKAFVIKEADVAGMQGYSSNPFPSAKQPKSTTQMDMPAVKLSFSDWSTLTAVLDDHLEQVAQGKMVVALEDLLNKIYQQLGQKR